MKAMGGTCAGGFISGASQAKIAGSKLTEAQKAQIIPLAAALGGFVTANGKGINVSFGVNIATGGFENNYLKHNEVYQFANALAACQKQVNSGSCRADVYVKYQNISWANRAAMEKCQTIDCWNQHRKEIEDGLDAAMEILRDGRLKGLDNGFTYLEESFAETASRDGHNDLNYVKNGLRGDEFLKTFSAYSTQNCTRADKACMEDFRDDLWWQKAAKAGLIAAEILTPYGTIVAGYECYQSLDLTTCLAAGASLIPTGAVLKAGGKLFVVTKNGTKTVAIEATKTVLEKFPKWEKVPQISRKSLKAVTPAQLAEAKRLGVDPKWVKPDGKVDWPLNDGFHGVFHKVELAPGVRIDRYGNPNGGFFSPVGTPFDHRALPNASKNESYTVYEVLKPLPVKAGRISSWFDKPGGGIQYQLDGMNVPALLEKEYIRIVQ